MPAGDSVVLGAARELVYERMNAFDWAGNGVTSLRWDAETSRNPAAPFFRCAVRHTGSRQLTQGPVGTRRFLRTANLVVQIFGPAGDRTGVQICDNLAKLVRDLFEGINLSGLTFEATTVQEIGFDGRSFFQVNTVTPFWYCEIR